jgi:hypothetical protein
VDEELEAEGRDADSRRKQDKSPSGAGLREATGRDLRILDSHTELWSPALEASRSPLRLLADRTIEGFSSRELSERTGRTRELLRQDESESTGKRNENVEKFEACGKSARKFLQTDLI